MTPALRVYLLAAARAEPLVSRRAAVAPAVDRPPGEVIWLHLSRNQPPGAALTLAARIAEDRDGPSFVVTSEGPPPEGAQHAWEKRPPDFPRAVETFLSGWRPDAGVWIGGPIWPVLAARARQAGIPMILANATAEEATVHRGLPARDLLGLFHGIVACGPADGPALERAARRAVTVLGPMQASGRPLEHDEAEHLRLSAALEARPVWFAARMPASEVETVARAHAVGQVVSHRLLLIAEPADVAATMALCEVSGARRSTLGAPAAGVSTFIADVPDEAGLWYRLASVSFIGGSLGGPRAMADPFAPAALGSAILHGPVLAPYEARFAALAAARATRPVGDPSELGQAVADTLAPDRAATLAHHAWAVVSDGAEATDHVAAEVGRLLDAAP